MPSGSPDTSNRTAPQKHSPAYVVISFLPILSRSCVKTVLGSYVLQAEDKTQDSIE
jgi:hypothetical protein